jgi:Zn-dependent M28 family amino/carboxypeptidase
LPGAISHGAGDIDYDYGYNNAFWHTAEDTIDKLSFKSLQIVEDVVLEAIQKRDNPSSVA